MYKGNYIRGKGNAKQIAHDAKKLRIFANGVSWKKKSKI